MSIAPSLRTASAFALLLTCACSPDASAARGGVLLLVIDELRADHCSLLGYDRATTPELDQLAQESVVFDNAFSCAPWDVPAHMALLTGCDPGVAERLLPPDTPATLAVRWRLPQQAPSLPEEMLRAGYATAAFVDSPLIGPALGFERGFQKFQTLEPGDVEGPDDVGARAVFARVKHWLNERDVGEPWFVYAHVADLTRAWQEPDPAWDSRFKSREELDFAPPVSEFRPALFAIPRQRWSGAYSTLGEYETRYDGAIARLDAQIGELIDGLRARADFADTTIVVASSHGVSFGEGGFYVDHGGLTDADLRALLIVRPADRTPVAARGTHERAVASLIDVAPTVFDLRRVEIPRGVRGYSWAARIESDAEFAAPERIVFAKFGRFDGYAAMDSEATYSWIRPWIADPIGLRFSWYGGSPTETVPVESLVERSSGKPIARDGASAARIEAYRTAAASWQASVEEQRRRYHPIYWTPSASTAPDPAPAPSR